MLLLLAFQIVYCFLLHTLGVLHELSLATLPEGGLVKVPTPGESSAASLPWMKNPLKVGLLPAAERVTAWRNGEQGTC